MSQCIGTFDICDICNVRVLLTYREASGEVSELSYKSLLFQFQWIILQSLPYSGEPDVCRPQGVLIGFNA